MSLEEKEAVVTYLAALTSPAQLATFIAGLADKFSTRTRAVNDLLRSSTVTCSKHLLPNRQAVWCLVSKDP